MDALTRAGGSITRKDLYDIVDLKPNALRARLSELRKKGLIEVVGDVIKVKNHEPDPTPEPPKFIRTTEIRPRDVSRKVTIVMSDLHLGDANFMLETFKSTISNLLTKLREIDAKIGGIEDITVIINGDVVSGRNIFRSQVYQNVENIGNAQVYYAADYLKELVEALEEFAPVHLYIVKGNHDTNRVDDFAALVVDRLKAEGIDAIYSGDELILNLGNMNKEHWALFEHGYGGSDYYPVSYELLRHTEKKINILDRIQRRRGLKEIERVVFGHSHWLLTNFRQTAGYAIDVSGGFQRNNRVELGKTQRPVGLILYVFDESRDGLTVYDWEGGLRIYEIVPDWDVFYKEVADRRLAFKVREDIARRLAELTP